MTDFTIRPAEPDDHAFIAQWTAGTFEWGDYVSDRLLEWLEADGTAVFVGEVNSTAVAMARIQMVSATEAWSSAMRVHPEFRRVGLGTAVAQATWQWARERGAQVVRLASEDWNEPAHNQARKAGFRDLGHWLWARRGVGDSSPVPEGNGGMRVKAAEALRPAHRAEAEPALLSWSGGELSRAAHGLFPIGWTWQRLRIGHLTDAASRRALWEGRTGWAIADMRLEDRFDVHWIETSREDARHMVRALVERAAESGADSMRAMLPEVDWLIQAFRRAGFETGGITVFGKAL